MDLGTVIAAVTLAIAAVGLAIAVEEFIRKRRKRITKRSRTRASKSQGERLILSNNAKRTLKLMQSDPTDEGVFVVLRALGPAAPRLVCINHTEIDTETNQRVLGELEAKGLVAISLNSRGEDKVTLTPLGWDLNPETGAVDEVR